MVGPVNSGLSFSGRSMSCASSVSPDRHRNGPLNHTLQLSDIAGPGMAHQFGLGRRD